MLRLIGMRGFGDYQDRRVGGDGGVLEPAGNFWVVGAGHVDDYGRVGSGADAGEEFGLGRGEKVVRVRGRSRRSVRETLGSAAPSSGDAGDYFEIVGFTQD